MPELNAWVQLIQVTLLLIVLTQNFGFRAQLKAIEAKLDRVKTPAS